MRTLTPFGVCSALLRTFNKSVVASAILYAVVCWGSGNMGRDKKRMKSVSKADSILGIPLDFAKEMGKRRKLAKLTSIHPSWTTPLTHYMRRWSL